MMNYVKGKFSGGGEIATNPISRDTFQTVAKIFYQIILLHHTSRHRIKEYYR